MFISWEQYNEKLDIWSVGCVIAELILLKPLFPGSDYVDQLRRILNVVGTPDVATLEALCQPRTSARLTGDECYQRLRFV